MMLRSVQYLPDLLSLLLVEMHFLSVETADWNLTLHLTGNKTKFPDSVSDHEQYFQFLPGKSVHWEPLQPLLESRELESILRLILKKPTCVPVTGLPICRLRVPPKSAKPSPPVIMTNHVSSTLEKNGLNKHRWSTIQIKNWYCLKNWWAAFLLS